MGIYVISTISRNQRTTNAQDSSTRLASRIETHNQRADEFRIQRNKAHRANIDQSFNVCNVLPFSHLQTSGSVKIF